MNRTYCLVLAMLLLALSACGGGGSAATSATGLTPLDFDVTTDSGSTVQGDDVIGYAVERTNPMYAAAETKVPAGYKIASILLFQPETGKGQGFSGDFTVRTDDKSMSAVGDSFGAVYRCVWDSRSQVWNAFRTGFYGKQGKGGVFRFHLDYLGIVELLVPTGSQFQVAAFADLATAQVNTDVNFWVLQRNGVEPITYHWDFGDGTSADGDEVTHSYPLINDYDVTVTATDGAGNTAPVASTPINIVGNPVLLTHVDVVVTDNLDGTFSYSSTLDGGTLPFTYDWDMDGDAKVDSHDGPKLVWSPKSNLYRGHLTVTDQTGASASTEFITDARRIQLATILANPSAADPLHGYAPQPAHFTFTSQGTTAQDSFTLDFGDGSSDTILTALDHTYPAPGVYPAVLTVSRDVPGFGTVSKQADALVLTIAPRPAPHIDSVTPGRGIAGSQVTIAGDFFFDQEAGDEVRIADVPMPVVTWEPKLLTVTVPTEAKDGDITVHKKLGSLVSNGVPFDVAPTPPGQPGTGQL